MAGPSNPGSHTPLRTAFTHSPRRPHYPLSNIFRNPDAFVVTIQAHGSRPWTFLNFAGRPTRVLAELSTVGLQRREHLTGISPFALGFMMQTPVESSERLSTQELIPLFYDQLRRLAARKIQEERPGITIQPTALVHEAWLRLQGTSHAAGWKGGAHFVAAAAEAMRRILVESARRRTALKRGGGRQRVSLEAAEPELETADRVLALDDALQRLAEIDSQKAEIVRLRFFGGLTIEETAAALAISPRSADRGWAYARAWLLREIGTEPSQP